MRLLCAQLLVAAELVETVGDRQTREPRGI